MQKGEKKFNCLLPKCLYAIYIILDNLGSQVKANWRNEEGKRERPGEILLPKTWGLSELASQVLDLQYHRQHPQYYQCLFLKEFPIYYHHRDNYFDGNNECLLNLTVFPEKKNNPEVKNQISFFNNMILAWKFNSAFKGPALNSGFKTWQTKVRSRLLWTMSSPCTEWNTSSSPGHFPEGQGRFMSPCFLSGEAVYRFWIINHRFKTKHHFCASPPSRYMP